jgi:hypothetical protein
VRGGVFTSLTESPKPLAFSYDEDAVFVCYDLRVRAICGGEISR